MNTDPSTTRHVRRVELAAPPHDVWPWLVQMGDGRAGWYSLDLLERLLGASGSIDGWRSLDRVEPSLQGLDVGDRLPLGRGATLEVTHCDPPRRLGLRFDDPVGPGHLVFDWSFTLVPVGRMTQLEIVTSMQAGPRPWGPLVVRAVLSPGHRVMEFAQVRGLRHRVEERGG